MSIDFSRVQAICFDVDGTLSDTDNLWVSKFKKVFSPIKPVVKEEPMRAVILRGARFNIGKTCSVDGDQAKHLLIHC